MHQECILNTQTPLESTYQPASFHTFLQRFTLRGAVPQPSNDESLKECIQLANATARAGNISRILHVQLLKLFMSNSARSFYHSTFTYL